VQVETPGIVCAVRGHGEHGAVVRLMTAGHGLVAGYVRGGRGRRMRPVLIAGNLVQARLRSRSDEQLPFAEVELVASRAPLLGESLPSAAVEWATALTAAALPERHPYPRLFEALDGLLSAIEAAPSAAGWAGSLIRFELLLLAELGFGLDLGRCAVSGSHDDLVAVSPRSGRAVSAAGAEAYEGKLLPLPVFLIRGGRPDWAQVAQGLALTGHFLGRDILAGRPESLAAARGRLADRLRRAGGAR